MSKITKPNVTREKLLNSLLYEKCARKTKVKVTTGVNFTNILQAAFTLKDPKSKKRH